MKQTPARHQPNEAAAAQGMARRDSSAAVSLLEHQSIVLVVFLRRIGSLYSVAFSPVLCVHSSGMVVGLEVSLQQRSVTASIHF